MEIEPIYSSIVAFLPREDHVHFAASSRSHRSFYERWKRRRPLIGGYWLDDNETRIARSLKPGSDISGKAGVAAAIYNTVCSQFSLSIIVPIYYWRHTSNILLQTGFTVTTVPGPIVCNSTRYISPMASDYYKRILNCKFDIGFVQNQASVLRAAKRASSYTIQIERVPDPDPQNWDNRQYITVQFDIGDCYDEMAIMPSSRQILVTQRWHSGGIRADLIPARMVTLSEHESMALIRFNDSRRLNASYCYSTADRVAEMIQYCASTCSTQSIWRGIVVLPRIIIASVTTEMMNHGGNLRIYVMDETENDIASCLQSMNIPPAANSSELIIITPGMGRAVYRARLPYPFHFALDFCGRDPFTSAAKTIYCPDDPFDALLFRLRRLLPTIDRDQVITILSGLPGWADRGYHWTDFTPSQLLALDRIAADTI